MEQKIINKMLRTKKRNLNTSSSISDSEAKEEKKSEDKVGT